MKKLLFVVCAIFGFIACTQNPIEEQSAIRTDAPETIRVGFEDSETRIQFNEAQKTVWTKNDLVSVFYKSDANQMWEYRGETGERVADLYRVDAGTASSKMSYVVLVYPYSTDYVLSTASGNIETTLPATQHYATDSYAVGENLMVSRSEFTQFSLKSVCGWLKLQLTGDGEVVKSIKFRGNNNEQVAGLIYVDTATAEATLASDMGGTDDNNAGGNLVFDDTILTEVTLDCGEGVTLGKSTTAFYIALPPQTFANGFTVEIEDTDGYVMEQSTAKTFIVERNTISPMAALEFINPNQPNQPNHPTPANNEIWYTATEKAEPYFDDFVTFGSDVVSNVWDSETKRGIITFDGDVTMIGDDAFNNCDKFTGITLPESVTSIGKNAFYNCNGLTEFIIPDSVTTIGDHAFYGCYSLTSVTIGDSVTTIGDEAFYDCDSLTSVTIGDSVTTIGDYAFKYCSSLTSVTIPDSVTSIGNYAFQYCSNLTSVTIGDSVTTIGESAFYSCYSLTSVTIGDSVTTIGEEAFWGCGSLTSVTIGDSVTTIGEEAFRDCSSLTSVTIGDSVTTIGWGAFYDCYSLTSVTIPDSVTTIEVYAFGECSSLREFKGKFASEDGRCLIIDGVLNYFAPAGLTEYTIPNSVTTIGGGAFDSCYSLTSVTIPDSVTTIGNSAFEACSSITSVTIPDSVTTIGIEAFSDCSSLKKVYCNAIIPPSLGNSAFSNNATGRRIYVYEECVELYKSAWSSYKDSIYTNGQNCPTTTIEYTTNDSNTITSSKLLIISNIYENGVGTLVYSGKQIPNDAFCDCTSLTSVNIPDSVTTIGKRAFSGCSSLTSVTIGDSVATIGGYAFAGCSKITEVNISDISAWCKIDFIDGDTSDTTNVTANPLYAGGSLYLNGEIVKDLVIPSDITEIKTMAFRGCSSLTSVTIGSGVTTIGEKAFHNCSSLTSVTIPDSVTSIGNYAFRDCSILTSVTIPDSVTSIGNYAFQYCSSLTSVTIGDSVTTIGDYAFYYCYSLTSVYCKAVTPPTGSWDMFYNNASGRMIYVPTESVEAYKSAEWWSSYASDIEGYNF